MGATRRGPSPRSGSPMVGRGRSRRRSSRTPPWRRRPHAMRKSTPSRGETASIAAEDPAQLAVPPLQVRREPIVALGQLGELVFAGHPDRGGQVAGRDPVDCAAAIERSGAVRSATSRYDVRIASVTTIASENSSRRPTFGSGGPLPVPMRRSRKPKPASGRMADAISAIVRRVRNANRRPRSPSAADDAGVRTSVVNHRRSRATCPAGSRCAATSR